ncbi:hypothetical protein Hdeb2414_s0021g00579791 [Helianthus debilis subsp. tardiflorus]
MMPTDDVDDDRQMVLNGSSDGGYLGSRLEVRVIRFDSIQFLTSQTTVNE